VGRGIFPLDEELGLSGSAFSPYLVEAMVRLGTELPFTRVPELLGFFTQVGIGEETARVLTERAGAVLCAQQEAEVAAYERRERPVIPEANAPAVQQVSADGAMVHLVAEGWVEVKPLAIGRISASPGNRAGEVGEVHATELSYFSRLDGVETFRRLAAGELGRRGTYQAQTVCAVMDGAEWLQGFVDWHVPKAVRILDFPHAAEHLGVAAHAVFGPGTAPASEWLGTWVHELRHGDPDQVLAALRDLPTAEAPDPVSAAQTRDEVLAYLEKRREQIAYAAFAAAGYPIGSGMVESANKLVVEARLKGSGMHWARQSVNPLLALRTAACSGRWREVWPGIWQGLCARRRGRRRIPPTPAPIPIPASLARPALLAMRLPALKREPNGLVQNGRPTTDHPWKAHPLFRPKQPAH
jgi:hypothetical protein